MGKKAKGKKGKIRAKPQTNRMPTLCLDEDEFCRDQYGIKEYVNITGLINKNYLRGRRSLCFQFISKYGIQVCMY